MSNPKPTRARSREQHKRDRVRVIPREYMTDFDQGAPRRDSALSQSQLSEMNQDSTHRRSEEEGGPGDPRGRDLAAVEGGVIQSGAGEVGEAVAHAGPVFDAAAKAQFVQEIRADMKGMIK